MEGKTVDETVALMNITKPTLYGWFKLQEREDVPIGVKSGIKLLEESIKDAKKFKNWEVQRSLIEKCKGFKVEVRKIFKCRVKDYDEVTGKVIHEEDVLREGIEEIYVPPSDTAIIFFLINNYRDKYTKDGLMPSAQQIGEALKETEQLVIQGVYGSPEEENAEDTQSVL